MQYPNTYRWFRSVGERPGVIRGRTAERAIPDKYMQRAATLSPEEWSNMFGDRMLQAVTL
jgi:GST-like protein